ncbi:MAG: MerC domain-containing protein [Pseudomonadota bacterium]
MRTSDANASPKTGKGDLWAIGLSSACMIHCLSFPLLGALLPLAAQLDHNHTVHLIIVACATPITLWVVWQARGTVNHRRFTSIVMTGLALLWAAVLIEALEIYEVPLTVIGSLLIAGAHLFRWRSHGRPVWHKT